MSYTAPIVPSYGNAIGTLHRPVYFGAKPTASVAYPTADLAIYLPLVLETAVVVKKLYCCNGGTVAGNVDVGVYNASGTRLVSAGSTAQSGVNAEQVFDVTDTFVGSGLVYLAVTLSSTGGYLSATSPTAPLCAAVGFLVEQLGAGAALPATATWTVSQTIAYLPHIGMLVEATVA